MNDPDRPIPDDDDSLLGELDGMSDADLERLMGGDISTTSDSFDPDSVEPGTRVSGTVVEVRSGEVLIELDGKNLGVVDIEEFDAGDVPVTGTEITAEFVRNDPATGVCVLSTNEVRTEVAWEELRVGTVVSGLVTEKNRGGLTIDIKGIRAFMPISQIELHRIDDLDVYVGRTLQGRVTQVDRADQNLIISRRELLEEEARRAREEMLATIEAGSVVLGTVTRVSDFGAFVDIGGVDGLLHISKIRENLKGDERLSAGQKVRVQIVSVDRDRERISLDFHWLEEDSWAETIAAYSEGDIVTGWVSQTLPDRAIVKVDDGVQATLTPDDLGSLTELPESGSILRCRIVKIDPIAREVRVRAEE